MFLILLLALLGFSYSGEYALVPPQEGSYTVERFFDEMGLPDIREKTECSPNSEVCYKSIVNGEGRVLAGPYNTKYNDVNIEGRSRFRDRALALVRRHHRKGENSYTEYFLVDDRGHRVRYGNFFSGSLLTKPLPNGNVLVVRSDSITEYSPSGKVLHLSTPLKVEYAHAGNNPEGLVSLVAIGGNDLLFMEYSGEESRFLIDPQALTKRGDRLGVLSIYPERRGLSYSAVYRYVNEYNKGIVLYELDFKRGVLKKGFLFNSELRNIGFNPSVFSTGDRVIVSAINSSDESYVHFVIPKDRIPTMVGVKPEHIRGFEHEKNLEFLLSAKVSALTWNALSQVRKGGTTYAEVKYDMSNSIFYGSSVEGRVGDTQLSVTYMQSRAEEKGGLSAETSRFVSAVVDFHGLLGRYTLRVGYDRGRINGIAKFKDSQRGTTENAVFETDLKTYYAYVMMERGLYGGVEFMNYKIPSAVGYSDSNGSVVAYGFDREFTLSSLILVAGYDKVSYAKRYETNFSKFYFAGNGGLGLGTAEVSSEIENRAKQAAGASDTEIPLYVVLKAYGELGYIHQRRAKLLKGLGFSINLGYRFTFMLVTAGNDGEDKDPDKVYLEFSRYELLHGPFLQANLIF